MNRTCALTSALALAVATHLCPAAESSPFLVKSGKPACTIVVPNDATGGESYAAKELQDHIKQISGADLPVTSESLYSPAVGPCVSIGRTALSQNNVTGEQWKSFGDDGYRVFSRDGNLFFTGGRKRGPLYAVYEFLESLGVRWYSPTFTVIPKLFDIHAPQHPFEFTPPLKYRAQYWDNGFDTTWLARMRLNGNITDFPKIPESMGGCIFSVHYCHSYNILVPPETYFDKHPEWYGQMEDGKRSPHVLCLTNPALRDHVTSRVLSDLRACPNAGSIWVSQNDGGGSACFCDKCTAQRTAHGGKDRWSANTLDFVNDIAGRVKPEFPNVLIRTLAYTYTKEPPENMNASDNILIEICGNFRAEKHSQDQDVPAGAHERTVSAWSKIVKNISVYTYGGSNFGYWWPFPNIYEMGMQPTWALENGVTAFYVQGTALGKGSGLADLRAYLSARMAWDPSRDVKKEVRDFCDGFYGPAGKHIVEYLDTYVDYLTRRKLKLYEGWGEDDAWRVWVTRDAMDQAEEIFQKALAAVNDEPALLAHVRQAYLEVLWGQVMLTLKPTTENKAQFLPGTDVPSLRAKARLFGEIMHENAYTHMSEWQKYLPNENLMDLAAKD